MVVVGVVFSLFGGGARGGRWEGGGGGGGGARGWPAPVCDEFDSISSKRGHGGRGISSCCRVQSGGRVKERGWLGYTSDVEEGRVLPKTRVGNLLKDGPHLDTCKRTGTAGVERGLGPCMVGIQG
eukprot:767044-Hanusia_phi.AAC.1